MITTLVHPVQHPRQVIDTNEDKVFSKPSKHQTSPMNPL
ncbi:protein of unknown function [Shewanella benthica]|uniref:Uncharacterized protein n=1 Tax=Shewanella benthica TaxID=43661 RepID=A0A330M697_9GAMM|nr:protein of unknown function [Shewanella benthica]